MLGSILQFRALAFCVIPCLFLGLAAGAQGTRSRLSTDRYAESARNAVREMLDSTSAPVAQLRIDVLGEVVPPPDRATCGFMNPAKPGCASAVPLAALVPVVAYQGDEIFGLYLVQFGEGQPTVRRITDFSYGQPAPMTKTEYLRVESEFSSFYDAALDITHSPNRFLPFLAGDLAVHLQSETLLGERTSSKEIRRMFAQWLNFAAHAAWAKAEGVPVPDLSHWETPATGRVQRVPHRLTEGVATIMKNLRQCGAMESGRMAAKLAFLRKLYGEGLLAKRVYSDMDGGIPGIPSGTVLYIILVPGGSGPDLNLYFARLNGRLRIVTFTMDD